jgi:hypothetical protein
VVPVAVGVADPDPEETRVQAVDCGEYFGQVDGEEQTARHTWIAQGVSEVQLVDW